MFNVKFYKIIRAIIIILVVIWSIIIFLYQLVNPTLTPMQVFIEFAGVIIVMVIALIFLVFTKPDEL